MVYKLCLDHGSYSSIPYCLVIKHGSSQLRYVLFNAVPYLVIHNITFREFFYKKLHEGKNYRVAQSHVVKKLLRVIYHLELTGESFDPTLLY